MLDEGVQIMRQLWTEGTATLDGKHYQVDGAICRPLPLQAGGLPLWIAGGGEKKTLRIAAQYAQYTNFDATPEAFAHKSEILAGHCRDLGRDFGEITRSGNYNVVIGETEKDVAGQAGLGAGALPAAPSGDQLDSAVRHVRVGPAVGTPEQIVEQLPRSARSGNEYAITYFVDAAYDRGSMDLFASRSSPRCQADWRFPPRRAAAFTRNSHAGSRTPHLARPSLEPVIPLQGGCTCLN